MPNNSKKPSKEEFAQLVKEFIDKHPDAVHTFLTSPNLKEVLEDDSTNDSSHS